MDESDERIETEMVGGYPENIPVKALKDRWILAGNVVYLTKRIRIRMVARKLGLWTCATRVCF